LIRKAKTARSQPALDSAAVESARFAPRSKGLVRLLAAVSVFALIAIFASLAGAATTRLLTSSFDGTGSTPGAFSGVDRLALHQSDGALYVLDPGHATLDKFDAAGTPQAFSDPGLSGATSLSIGPLGGDPDVAVDNSGAASDGNIYVSSEAQGTVYGFAPSGAALPGFPITPAGDICGVGVDQAGKVWVDAFGTLVQYDASGTATGNTFNPGFGSCHFAFAPSGDLYLAHYNGELDKFNPSAGSFVPDPSTPVIDSGTVKSVAVDPTSSHVFAAHPGSVGEYDAAGASVADFGSSTLSGGIGVAVRASTDRVYVSDAAAGVVDIFGAGVTIADATTASADGVGATSATLHGTVNPSGVAVSDCHFEYGTDTSYGQTAPCTPDPGSGSADVDVSAAISGLDPVTTYHFRLVAVNANGTARGADQTFDTAPAIKDLATQPATAIAPTSATLNGTLDPNGSPLSDCHFDYVTSAAFQATGFTGAPQLPCTPDPGSGSGPVPVSASPTGLTPGTPYRFRLVATNANGTTIGATLTFTTLGPQVHGESATQISLVDAFLNAQANPSGSPTTYHFDYGTTSSYGQSTPESASIGSDSTDHAVKAPIAGLTPGTTYHFRVVLTNAVATTPGPDATFTTYASPPTFAPCSNDPFRTGSGARLPDCRAYEQASPVDKNGSDAQSTPNAVQAAADGHSITFFSSAGVPGGVGAADLTTFLSIRGGGSWATQGLLPPATSDDLGNYMGLSEDSSAIFDRATKFGTGTTLFTRDSSGGAPQTIFPYTTDFNNVRIAGLTRNGSRLLFEYQGFGTDQLAPGVPTDNLNLYYWDRETGSVSLAGALPDSACGSPPCVPPAGAFSGPWDWRGPFGLGSGGTLYYTQAAHVLSDDGDKAFFTTAGDGQVFVRQGLTTATPSTVHASASQRGTPDPNGTKPPTFQTATPSGSEVFFTSCEKLTDDSTAVSTSDARCDQLGSQGQDLYAYHVDGPDAGQLDDLTVDAADPQGADVRGVLGASDDGTYVYFVANGDLDGSGPATSGTCTGQDNGGTCSLYVWHDGAIKFIGRLNEGGEAADPTQQSDASNWAWRATSGGGSRISDPAKVGGDGGILMFRSRSRLTDYDNTGPCGPAPAPGEPRTQAPCSEFYRYDAHGNGGSGSLVCVSCNPTGVPPIGPPTIQTKTSFLGSSAARNIQTRNLSADGNRVFFETPDSLVASDTNAGNGCPTSALSEGVTYRCEDVYEWEAEGTGSCDSASQDGGCLYLLSAGTGGPSYFADASSSGDDAYIFTRDKLVGQDQDGLVDVYDARVGGGLASQNAPPETPCSGDACQGPATPPPADTGPGSSAFSGPGNQGKSHGGPTTTTTKKCKKGKKRKKGRKCRKARRANTTRRAGK
jgi:hypothetical protein